jgi:hypothetical protein
LSFIAKVPDGSRSLAAEGQPVIFEIIVSEEDSEAESNPRASD